MLRISLTGPESTGKTTLAAQLAAHYRTAFAPEFARDYIECTGRHYTLEDLEAIAHGQLRWEEAAAARATRVVFCDTDLLVVKIWAEHAFGQCPEWILRRLGRTRYDLTLLMGVDLPWTPDPQREHPHLRQHFYDLYLRELREQVAPFAEVWGPPERRFAQARFLVDELLANTLPSAPLTFPSPAF
jgi:NadR type nicotinamide-nucleotide adenylyltransferase